MDGGWSGLWACPCLWRRRSRGDNGTKTIRADVNRVLTDVVVRDKKTGALITGLKQSDFQVLEDKKPQKITTFDFQNVDQAVTLQEAVDGLWRDGDEEEDDRRPGEQ